MGQLCNHGLTSGAAVERFERFEPYGLRKGAGVERGPERMLNRKKSFYFINRVKIIVNYYKGKKYLYFLKIF